MLFEDDVAVADNSHAVDVQMLAGDVIDHSREHLGIEALFFRRGFVPAFGGVVRRRGGPGLRAEKGQQGR